MHFLILIVFGLLGVFATTLVVLPLIAIYILPRLQEMFADMGLHLPAAFRLVVRATRNPLSLGVLALAPLALALFAFFYAGGPALVAGLRLTRVASWFHYRLPWRRKRVHRDFSAMLGVLLDAGVPEAEALGLAARSTANSVFEARASRAVAALERGSGLTEAVALLDGLGELRWRLASAAGASGGFSRALAGWHESLEAGACQLEQAVAHAITTAIVVLHGAMVAVVAIGIFQCLVRIAEALLIW